MAFTYPARRPSYRRPASRGRVYRRPNSRYPSYPRRPAGSYSRRGRKATKRYGRTKVPRSYVKTPKNGFVAGCPLSQYQIAQVDAFDPRAVGVRIPDSNSTPSVGLLTSDDWNLGIPATNNYARCWALQPNTSISIVPSTGVSSTTWSWAANFGSNIQSNKYASVGTNFDLFRPVAHGVRISCSLASTAATGFCHIAVYPSRTTKTTWDFPTSISAMADCMWYTRITVSSLTQTPYVIQNKFLDCTANRYIDTVDTNGRKGDNPAGAASNLGAGAISVANEWCTVLIALEGANGTGTDNTPISAETLVHYEALPAPGGVQVGLPAAIFDPADQEHAAHLSANMPPVSEQTTTAAASNIQAAVAAVSETAGNVFTGIAANVGPRLSNLAVGVGTAAVNQYLDNNGIPGVNNPGRLQLTNNN